MTDLEKRMTEQEHNAILMVLEYMNYKCEIEPLDRERTYRLRFHVKEPLKKEDYLRIRPLLKCYEYIFLIEEVYDNEG